MDYYVPSKIHTASKIVSVRIVRRQRTGLYLFSSAGSSHAGRLVKESNNAVPAPCAKSPKRQPVNVLTMQTVDSS